MRVLIAPFNGLIQEGEASSVEGVKINAALPPLQSSKDNSGLQIGVRERLRVQSFPYRARALGLEGENFRSARAQNLKLVLVVVLVLQSEGRY